MCGEIRIYVAGLAAYNNGILHGVWIEACDDPADINKQISEMLANSPEEDAEEYAIHDYEGFEGYSVSEWSGIDELHEVACFIEDNPGIGGGVLSQFGHNLEDARRAMEDCYLGCYESLAHYAEKLTTACQEIPDNLAYYIDYESMGRDMELSGDVFIVEVSCNEVHVFSNY